MLISLDWLKKYVEIKESVSELENTLTMIGQEVEAIEEAGAHLENVVIGQVVEYGRHPESERLSLLKVNVGEEKNLQIICGAPNHKLNDKVVVAKVGAILPGDFKIKKSKIRNLDSEGMCCSEKELGMGTDHEGIIILPEDAPVGKSYREYLGLDDVIFELEITPNRSDCLSHIGIAREVAAYYKRKVKYPKSDVQESVEQINGYIQVEIQDKERCKAYVGRYIKNVKISESPVWLKKRIESMGLKSINNIVDISNFVMFEYNQPIHIFDADKINGGKIIVRKAEKGEKLKTLDGQERELNGELVIADTKSPVAIAGILGGGNSEIDNNSKNLFIEVAYFTPENIRRTGKALGISTDASYRFERGIDRGNLETVADRVAFLVNEVAGGETLRGIIKEETDKPAKREISLSIKKLCEFVGKEIKFEEVSEILSSLNLEKRILETDSGKDTIFITPPSYREDLTRTEDIYEEIIRMYGFQNIEDKMPVEDISAGKKDKSIELVDNVKNILAKSGLQEVINYSFVSQKAIEIIGADATKTIEIKNPINDDFKVMRPSLIYSLLSNIRDNFNRNQENLKFFEVSKIFLPAEELANEEYRIGIALSGRPERSIWN
ncbi:MAG: phenylalanine--tRNA ligase subunit beta, partial [Fusobacteriaceae bacterium]